MIEGRDFRVAVERVVEPDFILETSLWLPLERLVWKRWEAGAPGDVVCEPRRGLLGRWKLGLGPHAHMHTHTHPAVDSERRRSSRRLRFLV